MSPVSGAADYNEVSEVKVIVARIEERQIALAEKVGNAVGNMVPRSHVDALDRRVADLESSVRWMTRGALAVGATLVAGLYGVLKQLGLT